MSLLFVAMDTCTSTAKQLVIDSSLTLQQYSINFVNYYQANVSFTQTESHISVDILSCKKLILKFFHLIDKVFCKILTLELHQHFCSSIGNTYQVDRPVPIKQYLDVLITFHESIRKHNKLLHLVVSRTFTYHKHSFWLQFFQWFIILLHWVHHQMSLVSWIHSSSMPQPMFLIPSGTLQGYSVCETCGSILDIYIDYHQCLLQSNIVSVHMNLLQCISNCPFLEELFRGMLFKWKGANSKSHQKWDLIVNLRPWLAE